MAMPGALSLARKLLGCIEMGDKADCLEIGCGNGERLRYLRRKYGGRVIGTDSDPERIKSAPRKIMSAVGVQRVIADSADLPFRRDSFDVVMSLGSPGDAENSINAMGEITRLTRCGGYFIQRERVFPDTDIAWMESIIKQRFIKLYSSLHRSLLGKHYHAVWQKAGKRA